MRTGSGYWATGLGYWATECQVARRGERGLRRLTVRLALTVSLVEVVVYRAGLSGREVLQLGALTVVLTAELV